MCLDNGGLVFHIRLKTVLTAFPICTAISGNRMARIANFPDVWPLVNPSSENLFLKV